MRDLMTDLKRSFAIAEKDMKIFFLKGPVIIMGLLFPLFLFAAFLIGKHLSHAELFVALMAMTAFFTSTAVGPTIIPWEARSRTLERLLSMPVSITTVLMGDMLASFIFGIIISGAISLSSLFLNISINPVVFISGMILAVLCFSSLTILLSSYPPTDVPADVMMLSSLLKFTLLFISGIFIPLNKLPWYAVYISALSPLTYFTDILRYSTDGGFFPLWADYLMLTVFTLFFFYGGVTVHRRVLERRFM